MKKYNLLIQKRIKSFSKRSNTLNDLKYPKLDIIKGNENIEQNRFANYNKRKDFENIIEEDDIFNNENKIIDRDLNSLNINLKKLSPQLFNNSLKNTLSYNDLSIKKIFNKNIGRNKILNNLPKNKELNFLNNTFTNKNIDNINIKYLNNNFYKNNERKFNILIKTKNKENIDNKIRNYSSENKRNEIYKNNLNEFNYKAKPINNNYKNIGLYYTSNKKVNNEKHQNFYLNSKYRLNTEHKQYKSNQIFEYINAKEKNLFKSNQNKKEKNQIINNKINYQNIIIKPIDNFCLEKNYKLNNFAKALKYVGWSDIINATIQCLVNVEQLVKFFLSNKGEIKTKINEKQLSNAFLEIVENLWENKSVKDFSSINLNNIILNQMNNQIFLNSKELITFILDTLHKELNKIKNNNPDFNLSYSGENFDKYFQNYEKYYKENFQSIISDLFYQKYDCNINCINCRALSHQIRFTNILSFTLEKVKDNNNIKKKYISIRDCFDYYQKSEYDINKCTECKLEDYMGKSNKLLVPSKVLIININRINTFENKFAIDNEINLNDFYYYKENESKYELTSIMTYLENNQYIAFCKSFVDNKWYKYNYSKVTPSSFKEAKLKGYPQLLFYSLKEKL